MPGPEKTAVTPKAPDVLSNVEREAIAQIRVWRTSSGDKMRAHVIKNPAHLMHHLILASHGHVKLRIRPIATELGVAMRTLERTFVVRYGRTMCQCQVEARVAHSKSLLRRMPPIKISAIANMLGYDEVRDFHRFFERQMKESPSAWGKKERHRIKREKNKGLGDGEPL